MLLHQLKQMKKHITLILGILVLCGCMSRGVLLDPEDIEIDAFAEKTTIVFLYKNISTKQGYFALPNSFVQQIEDESQDGPTDLQFPFLFLAVTIENTQKAFCYVPSNHDGSPAYSESLKSNETMVARYKTSQFRELRGRFVPAEKTLADYDIAGEGIKIQASYVWADDNKKIITVHLRDKGKNPSLNQP